MGLRELRLDGVLRSAGHLNGVGDVGAALERLHDLLGAPKAFRVRVPDPTGQGLRSTVALGGCGYLLLFGRELYAPQVMLERAQVDALVHGFVLPWIGSHAIWVAIYPPRPDPNRAAGWALPLALIHPSAWKVNSQKSILGSCIQGREILERS